MTSDSETRADRPRAEALRERQRSLDRFAEWESRHPRAPTPPAALSAVGLLFDLLPADARSRPVDTRGVQAMHRALSALVARKR